MLVYVLLLTAATPETVYKNSETQGPYREEPYEDCWDGSRRLASTPCPKYEKLPPAPQISEEPLSETLNRNEAPEPFKDCPGGVEVPISTPCPSQDDMENAHPSFAIDLPPRTIPRGPRPKNNPGSWVTTNDYPSLALLYEWMGVSYFKVTVSKVGKVTECEVKKTSGYITLDDATCGNITRRARFDPALDDHGNPALGTYTNRVTWLIPQDDQILALALKSELESSHIALGPDASPRGRNKKPEPIDIASWIPDDPLPADWKLVNSARYRVAVSSDGRVDYCVALVSSGDSRYDDFICKHAVENAKFAAATDKDAISVKSFYEGWAIYGFGAPQHPVGK